MIVSIGGVIFQVEYNQGVLGILCTTDYEYLDIENSPTLAWTLWVSMAICGCIAFILFYFLHIRGKTTKEVHTSVEDSELRPLIREEED